MPVPHVIEDVQALDALLGSISGQNVTGMYEVSFDCGGHER
jgi:hypothetical protein